MEAARIEVGAVLQWTDDAQRAWRVRDERPFRVLAHDSGVVMYDAWWPHLDNWGLANLGEAKKRRINYYVVTTSTLVEKAAFVGSEPLTEAEISLHRPDLPFAAVQCKTLSWPAEAPGSAEAFARSWRSAGCPAGTLVASEVYLFPFGPKGGERAGVRVKADNGTSFSSDELVWKASVAQAPFIRTGAPVQGVGIYRSGLNRGIPAYYLWGSQSRMHDHIAAWVQRTGTD